MKEFHSNIGVFGHEMVILAFVTAILATVAYALASRSNQTFERSESWRKLARWAFYLHGVSVLAIIAILFSIIYNHYYEYHYAWSHSSNNLPTHFMISCFWEGQEGSFLLWIFWHVIIGVILLRTAKAWESQVMFVFAFVQAFLVSMILGVVPIDSEVLDFSLKIGSDPFILLRDALPNDATLQFNPEFVPEDGTGLNPLLQNYWMVIHPPTLFLGFALALVPFAFCIAGLQTKRYTAWIKPSLAWSAVGVGILGVGIMMGAYWAYETLNFGGYWNWDPVENAVYIPWLIWVVAIHLKIVYQRNQTALKASMIMVISTFVLVLYATFLTRSGVLGEASVHSFTDLGLSGQLLLYLISFILLAIGLLIYRWNEIPDTEKELSVYTPELWIFLGAVVLSLASFQVLVPTSIPVLNAFLGFFGIESNLAPPADQVAFYTKWQQWFGVGIALLSATGQIFWWKKLGKKNVLEAFSVPLIITFVLTTIILLVWGMSEIGYIIVLLAGIYSIVGNGSILLQLARKKVKLAGGAITHLGIAMMLLGILFSSGYDQTISINTSGLIYNKEFPEEMNEKNWLLFRNEAMKVRDKTIKDKLVSPQVTGFIKPNEIFQTGIPNVAIAREDFVHDGKVEAKAGDTLEVSFPYYEVTYLGPRMESEDVPFFVDKESLIATEDPYVRVASEPIQKDGKVYKKKGDSLHVFAENTYFEIEYRKANGDIHMLYPRIQDNERMGLVPSPDIQSFLKSDIYMHVTNMPDPKQDTEWKDAETFELSIGDTFFVNDYVAILDGVGNLGTLEQQQLKGEYEVGIQARVRVLAERFFYRMNPIMLIRDNNSLASVPSEQMDLGLRLNFTFLDPEKGKVTIVGESTQKDWIIMNAREKPYISLLWIGTIVMGIGFTIVSVKRFQEMRKKEVKDVKSRKKHGVKGVVS